MLVLATGLGESGLARAEQLSTDITVDLEGTPTADEDVVEDSGSGAPLLIDLGGLPEAAAISAYAALPGGDALFAVEFGGGYAVKRGEIEGGASSARDEIRASDLHASATKISENNSL